MATYEEMMMAASQRAAAAAAAASQATSLAAAPPVLPEGWDEYSDNAMAGLEQAPTWTEFSPTYFSTIDGFDAKMAYLKATNPDAYAEIHDAGFGGQWDKDINGNTLPEDANYRQVLENRLNNWSLATNQGTRPDALTYDEFTTQQTAGNLDPLNLIDPMGGTEDVYDLGKSIYEGDIAGALEAGTNIAAPGLQPTINTVGEIASGTPVVDAVGGGVQEFIPGIPAAAELGGQITDRTQTDITGNEPEPPWLPGTGPTATATAPPTWGPGAGGPLPEISRDDFAFRRIEEPWISDELAGLGTDLRTRIDTFAPDTAPTVGTDQALIDAYTGSRGTQVTDIDRIRDAAAQQEAMAAYMASQRGIYQDAAMGRVPSAAELQMNAGLQQALRSQLAAAKTQRNAGAFYTAGQVGDQLQAQTIQQQAILRAQEQEAARKAYSDYMFQEAQAREMAATGRTNAAAQQGALTAGDISRLAQDIDVNKANVDAELRTRAGNNEMLINYYNQLVEAEAARVDALRGKSEENIAESSASQEYAKTVANRDTAKYSTDVQAGSSKYTTDVTKQIEDEKAKVLREAAEMGALGTLGAGVGSALG